MFTVGKKDVNFGKKVLQDKLSNKLFNSLISQSPLFGKIVQDEKKGVVKFYQDNSVLGTKDRKKLYSSTIAYFLSIFWSANSKVFPNIKTDFVLMSKKRAEESDFQAEAEDKIFNQVNWGGNKQAIFSYFSQIKGFEAPVRNSVLYILWIFIETIRQETEAAIVEAERILKIGS